MKRFTKHWIGWGISDRVIPEGDPGILGSVCGGVLVIRRMAGSEGAEKWGGWLCFLAVSQGAVSGVHGFSAGDRAVCSSGIRG